MDRFLNIFVSKHENKSCDYAIFVEPQLDTGFPDIVCVSFKKKNFDSWNDHRNNICLQDIKLLHYLHMAGSSSENEIELKLRMSAKSITVSLERLHDACLIRQRSKTWTPMSLSKSFAVKKISAIEAKIGNWQKAFHQALQNKWFASESYVLSPIIRPSSRILEDAERFGIGIVSLGDETQIKVLVDSPYDSVPSCYACWLFNEWIGRRIHSQ